MISRRACGLIVGAPLMVAALVNWNDIVVVFDTVGDQGSRSFVKPVQIACGCLLVHDGSTMSTVSLRLTSAATIGGATTITGTATVNGKAPANPK